MFEDRLVLLLRRFSLSPSLQRNEKDAAVSGINAAQKVEPGYGGIILDARRLFEDFLALPHDLIGPLKGGRVGQNDLGKEVALVLVWQKPSGNLFAEQSGQDHKSYQDNHCDQCLANQEVTGRDELVCGHAKDAIEPVEKSM